MCRVIEIYIEQNSASFQRNVNYFHKTYKNVHYYNLTYCVEMNLKVYVPAV